MVKVETVKCLIEPVGHTLPASLIFQGAFTLNLLVILDNYVRLAQTGHQMAPQSNLPKLATRWPPQVKLCPGLAARWPQSQICPNLPPDVPPLKSNL